tara:strand:+ start:102 stop:509 length:408 start_codon:yes stop_codon:yes gene_type:complete
MEIKFNKKYKYLLLIILLTNSSFAEKKPVTVKKEIFKNFAESMPIQKELNKKNPLIGVQLDFNRKFNISNQIINESGIKEGESLLLDQNLSNIELKPGEYIRITDSGMKLFYLMDLLLLNLEKHPIWKILQLSTI